MAEHGIDGPVIGIAYDGTGFGTDGTAWGGEILLAGCETSSVSRRSARSAAPAAIRPSGEPWRVALALLDDAFAGEPPLHAIPLFRGSLTRPSRPCGG